MYLTRLTESTDMVEVLHAIETRAEKEFRITRDKEPPTSHEYTSFYNRCLSASYRQMAIEAFEQRNKLIAAMRVINSHTDCANVVTTMSNSCLVMAEDGENGPS